MLKLEGKALSVTVPITLFKAVGSKYQVPSINDYAMNFVEKLRNQFDFSAEDDALTDELVPYFSNIVYLPNILEKMLVNNITFSQAIKASENEMEQMQKQLGATMFFLRITGATQLIEQLLDEIINKIAESAENGEFQLSKEAEKDPFISVSLKNLPQAFLYTLDNYGLYKIAEQASQNPKLRDAIHNKTINPVIESVLKVSEEEDQLMSKMNRAEQKELQDAVIEVQEDSVVFFPLQTIISTILKKAIDDNITFSQAAQFFDSETLMKEIMEAVDKTEDLTKYQAFLEDITKFIK